MAILFTLLYQDFLKHHKPFWAEKTQDSEALILRQEISPAFQLIFNLVQVVIRPDQFTRSVWSIELLKLV